MVAFTFGDVTTSEASRTCPAHARQEPRDLAPRATDPPTTRAELFRQGYQGSWAPKLDPNTILSKDTGFHLIAMCWCPGWRILPYFSIIDAHDRTLGCHLSLFLVCVPRIRERSACPQSAALEGAMRDVILGSARSYEARVFPGVKVGPAISCLYREIRLS